jgi:hypothetical protein
MSLVLGLPLRDPQGLQNLLKQLYDPQSPQYRQFLSPDEFTARFAPTQADYQAVLQFAQANNLEVLATHPNRLMVDVTGTASDIQKAFHVNLHNYKRADGSAFFAPDGEPSLEKAVPITRVTGLDNFHRGRNHALKDSNWAKTAVARAAKAAGAKTNVGTGQDGLYQGQDLRDAYCNGVSPSLNGTGQSVGLFELDGYFPSDITLYQTTSTPPFTAPTPTNVLVGGFNGVPVDPGGNLEVSLDIEMVNALAPGAQVVVYEGDPNQDVEVVADDLLEAMATPPLCSQLSCSWFEFGDATFANLLAQLAAQGQSFFLASGDSGAFGPGDIFTAVPPPGFVSPFITEVGGTQLTTTSPASTPTPPAIAYVSESTWNEDIGSTPASSGGGICTNQLVIPNYQSSVIMAPYPQGNGGSTAWRNVPDVSMIADFLFTVSGDFPNGEFSFEGRVAGTSAAAPLWAAFTALANQQAASAGRPPLGFANYALYAIGQSSRSTADFHDISDNSTNNDVGNDPVSFHAVTGYDLATGWGSPNGQNLINDLSGSAFRSTPTPTPNEGGCGTVSSAQLQLEEFTNFYGNGAQQTFEVINNGATPVNLSDIAIKFWVDDASGYSLLGTVNFGGSNGPTRVPVNGVNISASNFTPACEADPTHQANWEITVSNNSTAVLSAGQTWGNIQTALHLADYVNFASPADWYSPDSVGVGSTYTNDLHYGLYYKNSPVTASGGSAPSCRLTCTPTFTFTPTHTPTPTPTITFTPTATVCNCQISQFVPNIFNGTNFDMAIDQANGVMYVPSAGTSQVVELNLGGGTNLTLASGSVTNIFGPSGLAFSGGFLYVGERLQWEKINPATNAHINTIVIPNLSTIPSLSVATNGDVYVAAQLFSGNVIQVYQPSGSSYVLASTNLAGISELTSVMISGNTLYAGEINTGNSLILQYTKLSESAGSLSFSTPTTLAGPSVLGSLVQGPSQLVLDASGTHMYAGGGLGALSVLNLPSGTLAYQCDNLGWAMGVGLDTAGNVYVSDGAHGQVDRMVNCGITPAPTATRTITPTSTPTVSPTPGRNARLDLVTEGDTATATPSPTPGWETASGLSMTTAPNITRDGQPIRFLVNLEDPASIQICLYNVTGEKVAELDGQGTSGVNSLTWNLENQQGGNVASGLYVYVLRSGNTTRTGKVVVLH